MSPPALSIINSVLNTWQKLFNSNKGMSIKWSNLPWFFFIRLRWKWLFYFRKLHAIYSPSLSLITIIFISKGECLLMLLDWPILNIYSSSNMAMASFNHSIFLYLNDEFFCIEFLSFKWVHLWLMKKIVRGNFFHIFFSAHSFAIIFPSLICCELEVRGV